MPRPALVDSHLIDHVEIVPVAFHDKPLLNIAGVHGPYVLRTIVIIRMADGTYGLGETYGDAQHIDRCRRVAAQLRGVDVFNIAAVHRAVRAALADDPGTGGHGMSGMVTGSDTVDRVFSPFEVAILDLQGKITGRPVVDLLGGAFRDRVPFSGYLFYKWAGFPGAQPDEWGEALTPGQIVAQAHRMVQGWGFRSLKLKGGVLGPDAEAETIEQLRREFPQMPLRLDPNGAWTVPTAMQTIERLADVLEYIEDPTVGMDGLAEVARAGSLPVATNMYVVAFAHLPEAIASKCVDVILSDHHFWGGLRRSQELNAICKAFGIKLSMHSNSHLGISLAAMVHLAAATDNLNYACDTHWPWKDPEEDVVDAEHALPFVDGSIAVPGRPGLGVELDEARLAAMNQLYAECGYTERDDTAYMRSVEPDFDPSIPRW
ncbi:enolase C-terminal domain-like protein [Pseudactinotalea sp. Z1748]|uniref:enolase C-terminal domain-like protein n=1 Tax=Pseudactinotalea sp. Z1748 TaxID=3413027 RepID=UPI003C7CABE7